MKSIIRKAVLLLCFFVGKSLPAQTLSFDYFVEEKRFVDIFSEGRISNYLVNTDTNQRLFLYRDKNKIKGSLFDSNSDIGHNFDVISKLGGFELFYVDSDSFAKKGGKGAQKINKKKNEPLVTATKIGDLAYEVNVYKNGKSKKPDKKVSVILEKFDKNYIYFFMDSHHNDRMLHALRQKIFEDGCCFMIKSYTLFYYPMQTLGSINKMEKVNVKVRLPDVLKLRENE